MKNDKKRKGFVFKTYEAKSKSPFEMLFEIFKELITHTSGDFDEAIDWLRTLDKEYKLTNDKYTIDDFIDDLKKKGYIKEEMKGEAAVGSSANPHKELRKAE